MKKKYRKPTMKSANLLMNGVLLNGSQIGIHDDETIGGDGFLSNQEGQMDIWGRGDNIFN